MARGAGAAASPRVDAAVRVFAAWLDSRRDHARLPGVSAALLVDGTVVWSGGYGVANRETGRRAAADTIYSICSISKLFTSIAVLQLRDAGKLRLSDEVAAHLPWFAAYASRGDGEPLTLERVLTHSAGLPREVADAPYWRPPHRFPGREEMIAQLREAEALYPPGQFLEYSNLGFALLGEVIAAASRQPYASYVTQHILAPLGMRDTRPFFPVALHGTEMAVGYGALPREQRRPVVPPFDTAAVCAAAGFTSTAADLAKFAAWQHRLLRGGGGPVLRASTLREMHRVHWIDASLDMETIWGLGFMVRRAGGETVVGHEGACPGYSTIVSLIPKRGVAAVVMVNAPNESAPIADAAVRLLSDAVGEAGESPREIRELPDLRAYEGRYSCQPFGSEIIVVQMVDELAVIADPFASPAGKGALLKLRRAGGDTFRRVRGHGEGLGEEWRFGRGGDGAVVAVTQHSFRNPKIGGLAPRPPAAPAAPKL